MELQRALLDPAAPNHRTLAHDWSSAVDTLEVHLDKITGTLLTLLRTLHLTLLILLCI